jgi:hypothetical protein
MSWAREWLISLFGLAVIVAVVLIAIWFLVAIGNSYEDQKVACQNSGGKLVVAARQYKCTHPSPQGSP